MYPLSVCRTPRAATINGLLEESVGDAPQRLAWVVADARAAGAQAVITEANSVSCGGKAGVSDARASAVWAVRFVLSALQTGFGEVRFHFSGDPYDPFYLRGARNRATPNRGGDGGAEPVAARRRDAAQRPGLGGIAATAIAAPGAQPLLLLDNGERKPRTLVLRGDLPAFETQTFSASGAQPALSPLKGPGAPRAGGDPREHSARGGVLRSRPRRTPRRAASRRRRGAALASWSS